MATGVSKSTYAEAATLNGFLRNTAYTPAATVYLAAFTVMPINDGTGATEVSGGAYARQSIAFSAPSGSPRATANSGAINFPVATANWGTVVGVGIYDASSGGNLLYYGTLNANQVINTGGQLQFAAGDITVTED